MQEIERIAVIGLGRVGLPFAITLHDAGYSVLGIDKDEGLIERLQSSDAFPFHEPGYDTVPRGSDRWDVQRGFGELDEVDIFIVTVGTPLDSNLTPNLQPIKQVIHELQPQLAKGKLLIFRSTLGLGVTRAISAYLKRIDACKNGQVRIAYCPERLAEGKAYEEIRSLPQIIGSDDADVSKLCSAIFLKLTTKIHEVSFEQAELIKLLCNTSRYMQFAISNWVHDFVLKQGVDPHSLLAIANDAYPRPIPDRPGFTAGTCLRKDYGLLIQDQVDGDYALGAWRVNERQPLTIVDILKQRRDLSGCHVAILGIGFKKDTDDLRDSLALKLAEILVSKCKHVTFHDPFVDAPTIDLGLAPIHKVEMEQVEKEADIIIIGANHTTYEGFADTVRSWNLDRKLIVVDIWNHTGFGRSVVEIGEANV